MTPSATAVFSGITLSIFTFDGQRWLTSPQIAGALGFERADAVGQLFKRHRAEFTTAMVALIHVDTANRGIQKTRVFSPRGAALIAMLSGAPRAPAFRKWVLDTLERAGALPGRPAVAALPAGPAQPTPVRPVNSSLERERLADAIAERARRAVLAISPDELHFLRLLRENDRELWHVNKRRSGIYDEARAYGISKARLSALRDGLACATLNLDDGEGDVIDA